MTEIYDGTLQGIMDGNVEINLTVQDIYPDLPTCGITIDSKPGFTSPACPKIYVK